MIIIIMGPPGSGKGTQCKIISKKRNMYHISTGDIIRYNIQEGTTYGKISEDYINRGLLVPDEIITELVEDYLNNVRLLNVNVLLDGYPRTIAQAEHFDEYLRKRKVGIRLVINLKVSKKNTINRISTRLICPNEFCGEIYNLQDNFLSVNGRCAKCGTTLVKRKDDNEEVISQRLDVYNEQTRPLIDYYRQTKLLYNIDGNRKVEKVTASIQKALEQRKD